MRHLIALFTIIGIFNFSLAQGFDNIGKKKYNNIYATIVGISDYSEVQDLKYANDDAQLFYDILSLSFPESKENFNLLKNDEASERSIKQSIYNSQKNVAEGDLVIIYFSGHGDVMLEPGLEEGFFLSHDASKSREYFIGGAVEFDWVNKMTNLITSKKGEVWLVTDACHAGSVINQDDVKATMTSLNSNFENTTKFISCQAHELSYEYAELQHGAFTYYLAKSLLGEANTDGDATLNIDEISSYLKREVRKYTGDKQSPRVSSSDEFEPFFNVTPEIASLIKGIDDGKSGDLASQGKGDGDTKKSSALLRFEKPLYEGNLYGSQNAAREVLSSLKSSVTEREYSIMENMLIDALLARSQRNTNLFLSGRPMIGANEGMASTAADLKLAAKLLGEDHFMFEEVIDKARFFEAMVIVQNDKSNDYSTAEKELKALQAKNPRAAYLNQGLGMLYVKMTKNAEATEQFDKAKGKVSTWSKPKNTEAYMNIAIGNLDKASEIIANSEALGQDDLNVSVLKTQLYSANMELQKAEEEFSKISVADDAISESEYYAVKAQISQMKGRISLAEQMYLKALKTDEDNIKLLIHLGDLYKNDGDTIMALKFYEKARKQSENNVVVKNSIALLSGGTVSNSGNVNYFDSDEVMSRVDVALANDDKNGAQKLLENALKVSKYDPELDYALGKVYYSQGNIADAENSLKSALDKSPYHFESIKSLVYLYILQKKFDEAESTIKKYNPRFERSSKWRVFVYEAYQKMKKNENAIFILEEALKLDSTDTEAYKALYRLHMSEGNYKVAEREYKKLVRLGGRKKDSTEFINQLIFSVEDRIDHGHKDNKAVEGLKLILKQNRYFLGDMLDAARSNYHNLNYRVADIHLEHYNKYMFALSGEAKYEYYRIKAYILLEVRMYQEALDLFKQVSKFSRRECNIGVAMAKYELGHGEEGWMLYFRQAKDLKDLNSAGKARYQKMSRNSGYHTPGGR